MRVFGERVEETLKARETSEEASEAGAMRTEAAPSTREAEENNLDHRVFRSRCPHCVKGRSETLGHRSDKENERAAPVVGKDYVCRRSEQEKEEENGTPILVMKDERGK